MTEQLAPPVFNIVCSGQPRAGFERAAVEAALTQLKMASAQIEQLLGGRRLIVKRGVAGDIANSYRNRLWAAGLDVDIVAVPAPTDSAAAPAEPDPTPAPAPTVTPLTTTDTTAAPATADATAHNPAVDTTPSAAAAKPTLSAAAQAADRRLAARWLLTAGSALAIPAALGLLLLAVLGLLLYHAVDHAIWLRIPPWWWNALLYSIPLLIGVVVIAALLRPLLPQPQRETPEPLDRTAEPALWQLIDEVAAQSGLPVPAGLLLRTGCEASATLAPGRAGWQRGDTVLTLGIALLQQPPLQRLAAVAAALVETLPRTAKLRRLVELIEQWLGANIERRDRWHHWLSALASRHEPPPGLAALLRLEQLYQQLTGQLFERLQARCRTQALPARRALLLEGDRFAAALTGSEGFADWRRMQRCWQWAADWAQPFALEHPVENLPTLIAHAAQQPPPALATALSVEFGATPAPNEPWPSERTRIDRIAALALPAASVDTTELDLGAREIAVTAEHYRALGIDSVEPLPAEQTEQLVALLREREQAATHYFNGWLHPDRGWRLPDATLIGALSLNDATEQLHVCVNEIRRLTPDRARLLTQRELLTQQLAELRLGSELLSLRQRFIFRTPGIDLLTLPQQIEEKQSDIDKLNEQLAMQESIMGGRLALGLRLSGQADEEVAELRAGLDFFHELLERLVRLHGDAEVLAGLARRPLDADARPVLLRLHERVVENSERLLRRLEQAPPFPERHVETPARRVRRRLPAASDIAANARRALALCSACRDLHVELSKLAAEWASGSEESYAIETIRRV